MFQKGADKGNPESQKMLGMVYCLNLLPLFYPCLFVNNSGTMCKEGKGHVVDKAAAFEYFSKSAVKGNSFAQYNLGNYSTIYSLLLNC